LGQEFFYINGAHTLAAFDLRRGLRFALRASKNSRADAAR
jgi:hypothetical protein